MTRRVIRRGWVTIVATVIGTVGAVFAGPPRPATEDEIRGMIETAGDAKDFDDAALVYLLDEADVYVQDSGLATTELCQVIKILTDAGVKSQSRLVEEFDPDTYRVTIKSVRIHRKDGDVENVPLSSLATQPAPQHMLYWGNQQHVLSLPRLRIGDTLEIRISKTGVNIAYLADSPAAADSPGDGQLEPPMPGHWFEVTRFQCAYPIVSKRYSVRMPKDKPVQYEVYNGELKSSLWFDGDTHVYTFTAKDVPPVQDEPRRAALDDSVTKVVMATVPDWPMKSRWFFEVNDGQFEADDAIRARVAEVTQGLETDEQKRAALLHWVADNIRYCGTKRGPKEGFTLHTGIETFRDRMGVCKDIAGMLVTMFRAMGYDSQPTLTMAGSRVEAIPADQFNHTVTVIREENGSFTLYDPTWAPNSCQIWSEREPLQGVVYGTPEGQDLTRSRYFTPEENLVSWRSESTIGADGALSARLEAGLKGYACTAIRRYINRCPVPERRAMFEGALDVAANARLEEFDYTDPYDYSHGAEVTIEMSADGYGAGDGNTRLFRLPLLSHPLAKYFLPELSYSVDAEKRKYGMRLRATRLVRYEETVKVPDGWTIEAVPEAKTMDSGSASLTFEATAGDGEVTYRLEMSIKNQIVPPEDYAGLKEVMDTLNALSDDWVVCSVEG
ncbi:MAG: DUF3857 domain-containing protein [Phycisphaerales bacterium]|nr:MAG: DUF3857 domain-containing protein [Phycisphaerales bacterium]